MILQVCHLMLHIILYLNMGRNPKGLSSPKTTIVQGLYSLLMGGKNTQNHQNSKMILRSPSFFNACRLATSLADGIGVNPWKNSWWNWTRRLGDNPTGDLAIFVWVTGLLHPKKKMHIYVDYIHIVPCLGWSCIIIIMYYIIEIWFMILYKTILDEPSVFPPKKNLWIFVAGVGKS